MTKRKKQQKPDDYTYYVMDEFGYISGTGSVNNDALTDIGVKATNPVGQEDNKKDSHVTPSVSSPKLDEIPESTPAGYLDPLHLPPVKILMPKSSMDNMPSPHNSPSPSLNPREGFSIGKVKCNECGAIMDAHRLQRHIVKMHQPKPKQIVCPHCHVLLQPENIKRHMKHAHGKLDVQSKSGKSSTKTRSAMPAKSGKTSQPLTACPVCGVAVGERRLAKHLRKVHPTHASQAHEAKVVKQKTPQQNEQSQRQSTTRQQQLAEFEQAFHESRFGDKYVGLSRREGNGRFGSLPLYDDYSDDADTD